MNFYYRFLTWRRKSKDFIESDSNEDFGRVDDENLDDIIEIPKQDFPRDKIVIVTLNDDNTNGSVSELNDTFGKNMKRIMSLTSEESVEINSIYSDEKFKIDFDTAIKTPILEVPEICSISDDNISRLEADYKQNERSND